MHAPGVYVHVFSSHYGYETLPTKGQCRLRYFLPVSCLSLPGAWDISIIAGEIHSNPSALSADDMQSQRTPGFNSEGP